MLTRALLLLALALPAAAQPKYNVLFLPVDDLKTLLGCYGDARAKTPNIDALAGSGVAFTRAYCQQAVCSPSRSSLLTGRRPDATRVWDLQTHFRKALPDVVTLPQLFKQAGYTTASVGKIYHGGFDDAPSWSIPNDRKLGPAFHDPQILADMRAERERRVAAGEKDPQVRGRSFEIADCADDDLPDGKIARGAIELLRANKDKPFFIAAGFLRPHLPFVAPKKYYDLHPPDSVKLADNPNPPADAPKMALHNSGELRQYSDIPKSGPIPDAKARELIRGYYAAASYMDAQVGRVLAELDKLGLADKTIVVLWGDHGWHLGDHGLWNKHTNFEEAARAPLIVRMPGAKGNGQQSDALVEFVDVYPTLAQLAGLTPPKDLDGTSLAPLLADPKTPVKQAAFSQYPRGKVMGYSMRTDRYRYTEWLPADRGAALARELYDHQADPQENANLANRPEQKEMVESLSRQLRAGPKTATAR